MKMGQLLKEKRQALNLTLEDVSDQLKISTRILKAIEEENTADYPPPTILKGFIRSYSKFLKLEKIELGEDQEPNTKSKEAWPVDPKSDPSHFEVDEELTLSSWLKWTFAGLLLVVGAFGVRIYQKYESEVYEPQTQILESGHLENQRKSEQNISENLVDNKNEVILNQGAILSDSPTKEDEAEIKIDPSVTKLEDKKVVVEEKNQNQENESLNKKNLVSQAGVNETPAVSSPLNPNQSPVVSNTLTEQEKKVVAPPLSQPQINFLPKEMIIEAKKNMTFTLKKEGSTPLVKNLEAGKFYLFREEKPFSLESPDGTSMRVIMNGRVFYKAGSQNGPIVLEIKE